MLSSGVIPGGYFHGRDNLTYGVDVAKIRWCGVLQVGSRLSSDVHCSLIVFTFISLCLLLIHCYVMALILKCELQRISIGYLFASISEIWVVKNIMVDSPMAFVRKYYIQGLVMLDIAIDALFYRVEPCFSTLCFSTC